MDKLRGMETFIAVVESGSFTRVSLPAGYVVGDGEEVHYAGIRAWHPSAGPVRRQSLTDAGRVYYDEAKRVLEQVAIAESAVERLRAAPAGTLRVTAPTSFGGCVIAPLTATFLQRLRQCRIELISLTGWWIWWKRGRSGHSHW
ncbi:LysR family transcriptional regulator [Enterobacter cloacae subsp. cloacae]|nr:LysR family transcriptional regulator [Enterobacter cloacae subsp. cloacae]